MKKVILYLVMSCLVLMSSLFVVPTRGAQADTNLIANPSAETPNETATAPLNWQTDNWGKNTTTFSYENTGYNSARSLKVVMSGRTSGDAKWFFDPVDVAPNTEYTYTDYFKASIGTSLVVMSLDAAGNPTYWNVKNLAASANWKKVSVKFTTPANAKTLTVLHLIRKNGWLQTDNVSLTTKVVAPPTIVPNPSLETVSASDANMPENWLNNSWGTNSPTFEYLNEGRTGGRSVKVSLSNYVDGDAKWYFAPQALTPGQDYRFSAWYKTNTTPRVVAMFTDTAGGVKYFGMPNPEPNGSANWQQYSDTFSVPSNTASVSVFFFIDRNGYVQTDDYSITPYQHTGFNQGMVSLTFDDGFEENVSTVLPKLDAAGLKSTQFYSTQYVEGVASAEAGVRAFRDSGHEIGSHTVTHPFLTSLDAGPLSYELTHSRDYLASLIGTPIQNFASPYGDYNVPVNNAIKPLFRSHRTVDEGYNSKDNFNIYRIRVQNMQNTTTLAQVQEWVNKAKADRTWLVLVYHRVTPNTPGPFDTSLADFNAQVDFLASSGIAVRTYNDALNELLPQL